MEILGNIVITLFYIFITFAFFYVIYLMTQINFEVHRGMMVEECSLQKRKIIDFKKFRQLFEEYDGKYDFKNNNFCVNYGGYVSDSIIVVNKENISESLVYIHADIIQFGDIGYVFSNSWEYHKYRKFLTKYCKNNFKKP